MEYDKNKYENIDNDKNLEYRKYDLPEEQIRSRNALADPTIKSFTIDQPMKIEIIKSDSSVTQSSFKPNYKTLRVQWFVVNGADAYEVRFYVDGLLMNNLTEHVVPNENNLYEDNASGQKFMHTVTRYYPNKYSKKSEITCEISAIKDGKYSDSDSPYSQIN